MDKPDHCYLCIISMLISYISRRTGQAPESSSGQDLHFLAIPKHRNQKTNRKTHPEASGPIWKTRSREIGTKLYKAA